MIRTACLTLVLFVLTGCLNTNIGIDRPEVTVTDIRLDGVSDGGGRVLVDLLVVNPNDEELPMPSVNYQIDVVGAGRFELTDRPYAALPKNGQTQLTLAAGIRGANLQGKRAKVNGQIIFLPQGELRKLLYDNFYPLPSSSFSHEAELR